MAIHQATGVSHRDIDYFLFQALKVKFGHTLGILLCTYINMLFSLQSILSQYFVVLIL